MSLSDPDLHVDTLSHALRGKEIACVITGSIGAVEAPRFLRALRRLGAQVKPYLTQGARQFTTPTAVSWAAASDCIESFSGLSPHIATSDLCVVAPASAHFIHQVATGDTSTPAACLVASFLGQKKPVLFVANMHDSLLEAPAVRANTTTVSKWAVFVQARQEEGKQKFPDPVWLANEVAHYANKRDAGLLVSLGTTRGYIDDIRYISNYSSGALGTEIVHEAYRFGFHVVAVAGPCPIQPTSYSKLVAIATNNELEAACLKALHEGCHSAALAASVLDFAPSQRIPGKHSSQDALAVNFTSTPKIIAKVMPQDKKIGFKLEADLNEAKAQSIARDYMARYDLSLLVINALSDVNAKDHKAMIYARRDADVQLMGTLESKRHIARAIVSHLRGESL